MRWPQYLSRARINKERITKLNKKFPFPITISRLWLWQWICYNVLRSPDYTHISLTVAELRPSFTVRSPQAGHTVLSLLVLYIPLLFSVLCPADFLYYEKFHTCFLFSRVPRNHSAAQMECRKHNALIVSLETYEKYRCVANSLALSESEYKAIAIRWLWSMEDMFKAGGEGIRGKPSKHAFLDFQGLGEHTGWQLGSRELGWLRNSGSATILCSLGLPVTERHIFHCQDRWCT